MITSEGHRRGETAGGGAKKKSANLTRETSEMK